MSTPDLFRGLRPPEPPENLRVRVLDEVMRRSVVARPSIWQRLWERPGLRVAWAAAVLALVAGHVLVSLPERASDPPAGPKVRVASASLDATTAPLVAVDRLDSSNLPNL